MYVLFAASTDLKDANYIRKGKKNLLQTKFGIFDTLAMCGKVADCKRTKFGVMLTLNDGENFVITAGTFNKYALQDATDILEKFSKNKEIYLLIYANPFYKNAIYLNANQDYCIFEVTKEIYEKFHEIRKKAQKYLIEKMKIEEKKKQEKEEVVECKEESEEKFSEISEKIYEINEEYEIYEMVKINKDIVAFIENLIKGKENKIISIEEVVSELEKNKKFSSLGINLDDKIYELMEAGYFYEPKPGYIKIVE